MAEWFASKRYGFGAGMPMAWQGWALTGLYVALIITVSILFGNQPLILLSIILPATVLLVLVAARTTRGGWRWRWGNDD